MASTHDRFERSSRRQFLQVTGGAAAAALAGGAAYAHHHPKPFPQSMQFLDQRMYLHNMELIAHILPGQRRSGSPQMMSIGPRRFLFQQGDVIEVTDPRKWTIVSRGGFEGGMAGLGYNRDLEKWILITCAEPPGPYDTPGGKYDSPQSVAAFRNHKNLRGIRLYDATDPTKIVKLSEYSTGVTGSGSHSDGSYYDGGKYAYLAGTPDDTFTHMLASTRELSDILLIVDVSDPMHVKPVANWWVAGQRNNEVDAFKKWPQVRGHGAETLESTKTIEDAIKAFSKLKYPAPDRMPYTYFHGPMYVPRKVEDGGKRGYGAWAGLGFLIHDLSDITKPKLLGRFDPAPTFANESISFHNVWVGMIDRGFVIGNPESMNPDCNEVFLPSWVIDIRDETNPVPIAQLPRPKPPKDAPYTDFCQVRGRFGAHTPPPPQAPGRPSQTFHAIAFFNAGLRCYDLSEPTRPEEAAYFIPPHVGTLSPECRRPAELDDAGYVRCTAEASSYNRPTDTAFVEWDRHLIYACTTSGVYVLSSPSLGKPILDPTPVAEWSLPNLNVGAPS